MGSVARGACTSVPRHEKQKKVKFAEEGSEIGSSDSIFSCGTFHRSNRVFIGILLGACVRVHIFWGCFRINAIISRACTII